MSFSYESGVAISFAGAEGNRKKWVSDLRFAAALRYRLISDLIVPQRRLLQDVYSRETMHYPHLS